MASQAEVDLIISTADALPELERDLSRIVREAEDGAPEIDIQASMAVQATVAQLATDLDRVLSSVNANDPRVDVSAALDAREALHNITNDLSELNRSVNASGVDEISLHAALDFPASLASITDSVRDLVRTAEATAPDIEIEAEVDRNGRAGASILSLTRGLTNMLPALGRAGAGIGAMGLAAGSAAPLLAGVATAVESIAPAAAVAVSGMLAVQLVSGTVKLAMQGVSEAVSTAFDPDATPEDLAKSMEKLAPNAKAFVVELRGMRKELKDIQQTVQQNFFAGFDQAVQNLGKTALPVLGNALKTTSVTLNQMALGAADAAVQLAQDGTLGRALSGANTGLLNLQKTPGQVVTALGQLGAAAAPAFDRITTAAANSATGISKKLSDAFASGALEDAINQAIDAIAQLGRIAGNVFGGLGNIIDTVSSAGGGLFATMEKVTQAFEDVTASSGFQQALRALAETAGVLVDTVLPVISQALQALGPVFQALAAPVQILVRALGDGLSKVIAALAPVLVALGNAFGQLVVLATPFIDLGARLIAAVLPALVPLFESLGQIINAMIPFVEQLVGVLATTLVPIFTTIASEVLPQLLPPFVELATRIFPVLTSVIVALAPTIAKLGETFSQLLVALTPLLVEIVNLALVFVDTLLPVIQPVLDVILKLITLGLNILSSAITGLVIPTIQILVDLLKGDFSAAWEGLKNLVVNVATKINDTIKNLTDKIIQFFKDMGIKAAAAVQDFVGKVIRKFQEMALDLVAKAEGLPEAIKGALGNVGNLLVSAGKDIVQGLINGLTSKLNALKEIAQNIGSTVTNAVKSTLGIQSPSKVMRELAHDTADGFKLGIADSVPALRKTMQGFAMTAPSFALPDGRSLALPQFGQSAPQVNVYLGNELLDNHVDARITQSNQARDRLAIRGVRR